MSPAEASAVELEEPDWLDEFELECRRWPTWPRHLAEDSAFESILKRWRRYHAVDDKPASAYDAMIALARLRLFPPRNLIKDVPRDGKRLEEQHDSHMWVIMSQRAWRVIGVEDKMLLLDSFGDQTQVSLEPRKWLKHTEKAVEWLKAWGE